MPLNYPLREVLETKRRIAELEAVQRQAKLQPWLTALEQLANMPGKVREIKEQQKAKQYEDLLRVLQFGGNIPEPQEKKLLGFIPKRTDPYSQIDPNILSGAKKLSELYGEGGEMGYNIRQKQEEFKLKQQREERERKDDDVRNFIQTGIVNKTVLEVYPLDQIINYQKEFKFGLGGAKAKTEEKKAETGAKAVEKKGEITKYQEKTLEMKERERNADPMRRARAFKELQNLYPKSKITEQHISTFLQNNPDF